MFMVDIQGIMLVSIAVPNLFLGSLIIARDAKNKGNVYFSLFTFATSIWSLGLGLFALTPNEGSALVWAKVYYIAAVLIAPSFLLFSLAYRGLYDGINKNIKYFLHIAPLLLILAIFFLPGFIIDGILYRDWGKEVSLDFSSYMLFSIYFALYTVAAFIILLQGILRSTGREKARLNTLFYGLLVAFTLGMMFNLIYPFFGNYRFIWAGPIFTIVYIAFIAYSAKQHRLFDLRAALVRSIGYILSVLVLAVIFGVVAFSLLSTFVFDGVYISVGQRVSYIGLFLVFAVLFQPMKRFFDKYTTKIFYRDSYEAQDLLDEFNKVVLSTIDLDQLLIRTEHTIQKYIRVNSVAFAVRGGKDDGLNIVTESNVDKDVINELRDSLKKDPGRIFVADNMATGALQESMRKSAIGFIARIAPNDGTEGIGYMFMGYKQSGSPYGTKDITSVGIMVGELAIAMQNAIQYKEIEQFNVTLQEKVDKATNELKRTNARLVALDEAKDEFVSMASHQLRTPLTSVKGYVSMVMDQDVGKLNPRQKDMLSQALFSTGRMVYLISDLLNVSRLKTGKFTINEAPTYLPDVVRTEIRQIQRGVENKELMLTFDPPHKFPIFSMDETKIRQVIMNFIDNAIYYTPTGGTVTVKLEEKPKSIDLTIKDTGIGVPKAERHKLFTKFYRAGNAKKARPDGTGLGLFMARKVIVAHGGSILFNSKEGSGSTFGFTIPKSKAIGDKTNDYKKIKIGSKAKKAVRKGK